MCPTITRDGTVLVDSQDTERLTGKAGLVEMTSCDRRVPRPQPAGFRRRLPRRLRRQPARRSRPDDLRRPPGATLRGRQEASTGSTRSTTTPTRRPGDPLGLGRADRRPDQRPPPHHVGAPEADPRGARAARHPLKSRGMDVEQLVAIDVHVHAERNTNEPQDPVTGEVLAAAAALLRRLAAAADRAGGRRPLPRAQDGRGDLHRRRRGGDGPQAARQRRGARGGAAPTRTS